MSLHASDILFDATNQMFPALRNVLDKAAAHAAGLKIDEAVFLGWRLAPDMLPMSRQVQIACDITSRGMARLAGADLPSMPDVETSFAELKARVSAAEAFTRDLDRGAINANPDGEISFPVGQQTMQMSRRAYVAHFILPNLYFHVTTAYANLRSAGVPLGKADFLGRS